MRRRREVGLLGAFSRGPGLSGGGESRGVNPGEVVNASIQAASALTETIFGQVTAGRTQRRQWEERSESNRQFLADQAARGAAQRIDVPIPWGTVAIAGAVGVVLIGGLLVVLRPRSAA